MLTPTSLPHILPPIRNPKSAIRNTLMRFAPPSSLVLLLTFLAQIMAPSASAADSTPAPSAPPTAPADRLISDLFDWEKLVVTPTPKGARRNVFDGPTATVDKMHCHISTLNPGEKSGEASKHKQEEVIIVKEGTLEANWDGKSKTGGPGSVIFFAAGATTFLRNPGTTPCTYIVIYYYTPLTPKS